MSFLGQFTGPIVGQLLQSILDVWNAVWWIALPIVAFYFFWDFWVLYIRFRFIVAIQWDIVEVKIPKEILKTPKAMEQIFAVCHSPYSYGLRFLEEYWEGIVEYWFSFEIVAFAGETHFYIRMPKQYRHLVESAIYGQYPGAEISNAEDYVRQMPHILPDKQYTLFGNEQIFLKPDFFPIRTYPSFEETVEERRVDPIGVLLETASKIKGTEQLWVQMLIRPTGDDWTKAGKAYIDKKLGREEKKKPSFWEGLGWGVTAGELVRAPLEHPSLEPQDKKKEQKDRLIVLTPTEKEEVEAIRNKISKLAFETTIRFLFIDKRETFHRSHVATVMGFFRQFNTQDLNLLRPNKETMSAAVHGFFKQTRLNFRRRILYERYRDLSFGPVKAIMNIEELATVYHFPIVGVESTYLEKVESKKGGPPAALPFIDDEPLS